MRTAFGIIRTNPNNRDTDGDGLTDGEEMGARYYDRYYLYSNPSSADSDNDGLIDPHEVRDNTCLNPFNRDSDGDAILDGNDTDPCGVFPPEEEVSLLVIARDFVIGGFLGDMGMPGGILEQPEEIWSSPFYLLGQILSGFAAIGDIRDMAENIRQGKPVEAMINALGLIPTVGDVSKMADTIKTYIKYAPVSKIDEAFAFINKVLLNNLPDSLTETVWKAFGKGSEFTRLASKGLSITQIQKLTKFISRFPGRGLDDIGEVILKDGKVVVDLTLNTFNPTRLDEAKMMIKMLPLQKIGEMRAFIKEERAGTIIKTVVIKLVYPDPTELDVLGAFYDIYDWTNEVNNI